jgi:hypothetical protein
MADGRKKEIRTNPSLTADEADFFLSAKSAKSAAKNALFHPWLNIFNRRF